MIESESYPCPRCLDVKLTKKFALRKKLRHWSCKKCKGVMLNVDDINKLPFIGSRIIKKHKLEKFLGSGDIGQLKCASCHTKMSEIHIVCKKNDTHTSPLELAGKVVVGGAAIVGMIVLGLTLGGPPPTPGLGPLGQSRKSKEQQEREAIKKKLYKGEVEIVTIDGCSTCESFWFDGGELERLKLAKIVSKYSGMSNDEYKKFDENIENDRDELLGTTSKKDKIEWEKEPDKIEWEKEPVNAKGKRVGKGTPSEGIMIYNEETKKWDFVPNSKD